VQAGQPSESTASIGSTGSVEDSVAPTQTVTVQAIDNTFRPDRIEVAPGTEVVWVNRGRNDHDLFAELGFGVTAAEFKPGDEYRHVFTEPGEYPYYCTIHGTPDVGMTGTIVVTDTA
jgi:plastocyanin